MARNWLPLDFSKGFKSAPETTGFVDFMRWAGNPPRLHMPDKEDIFKSDKSPHLVNRLCHNKLAAQRDDAFEVSRLREEVERLDAFDFVALFEEGFEVPHLGGGIAGDVDDSARAEGEELLEKVRTASLAGRVDEDRGFHRREGDFGEEVFGGGGNESGVVDAIGFGIAAGPVG
jgi:hypothetical protein